MDDEMKEILNDFLTETKEMLELLDSGSSASNLIQRITRSSTKSFVPCIA